MIRDRSIAKDADSPARRTLGLERYKTLGAALALGQFTVPELARLSGVGEATIRTTLAREKGFVEQIGTKKIGRRGGQPVLWRVRPKARERLRAELRELERVGAGPWIGEREVARETLPAGIVAAEDVLLRLVPKASDPANRAELVELARAQLTAANASLITSGAVDDIDLRSTSTHRRLVEQLLELEQVEQSGRSAQKPHGQEVYRNIVRIAEELKDGPLAEAVRHRLTLSPIKLVQAPLASPKPSRTRALFGHVGGPDPRMVSEMRRLQARVKALEAELVRLQEENDAAAAGEGDQSLNPAIAATRAAEEVASEVLSVADKITDRILAGEE